MQGKVWTILLQMYTVNSGAKQRVVQWLWGLLRPGMGSTSVIYYQCDLKQGTAHHGVTDFPIYEMKTTTLEGTL